MAAITFDIICLKFAMQLEKPEVRGLLSNNHNGVFGQDSSKTPSHSRCKASPRHSETPSSARDCSHSPEFQLLAKVTTPALQKVTYSLIFRCTELHAWQ